MWNLLVLIPTVHGLGLALTIFGFVDLAIAVSLLFAVIYQLEYLPSNYLDCQYAATWRNATGESNFFQVVGNRSSPAKRPDVICEQYCDNADWVVLST